MFGLSLCELMANIISDQRTRTTNLPGGCGGCSL